MATFLCKCRQQTSVALLVASVTTFGHGGCSTDLPYIFDDVGVAFSLVDPFVTPGFADVFVVEEPYYVDEYVYDDPYYYDDGFGFEFGFDFY